MIKKIVLLLFTLFFFTEGGSFVPFYDDGVQQNFIDATTLAATIAQSFLQLSHDVNIHFSWASLPEGAIADTSIPFVCQDPNHIFVMLPPALYVQQYGNTGNCASYNSQPFYHMSIRIANDPVVGFYLGTDPAKLLIWQHDLVSVVLHEMVHGLGMMSFVTDANGNIENAPYGFLFDWIVFGSTEGSGWPSTYGTVPVNNPAVTNPTLLSSGTLLFVGNYTFPLYTPSAFKYGVSISHTNGPGLMYYKSIRGKTRRTFTAHVISVLQRLGYTTTYCQSPDWSSTCGYCDAGYECVISRGSNIETFLLEWL